MQHGAENRAVTFGRQSTISSRRAAARNMGTNRHEDSQAMTLYSGRVSNEDTIY